LETFIDSTRSQYLDLIQHNIESIQLNYPHKTIFMVVGKGPVLGQVGILSHVAPFPDMTPYIYENGPVLGKVGILSHVPPFPRC
jgi:hypothetical protein